LQALRIIHSVMQDTAFIATNFCQNDIDVR